MGWVAACAQGMGQDEGGGRQVTFNFVAEGKGGMWQGTHLCLVRVSKMNMWGFCFFFFLTDKASPSVVCGCRRGPGTSWERVCGPDLQRGRERGAGAASAQSLWLPPATCGWEEMSELQG